MGNWGRKRLRAPISDELSRFVAELTWNSGHNQHHGNHQILSSFENQTSVWKFGPEVFWKSTSRGSPKVTQEVGGRAGNSTYIFWLPLWCITNAALRSVLISYGEISNQRMLLKWKKRKPSQVHSASFQKHQQNGLQATHKQLGFLAFVFFLSKDKLFVVCFSYRKNCSFFLL